MVVRTVLSIMACLYARVVMSNGAYRRTCSGMHAHVVMCKYAGPSMCVGVCISIVDIILWLIRSVFTVLCTLYDVHYTMYSVHCTLYVVQCAMCILRFTLQDV